MHLIETRQDNETAYYALSNEDAADFAWAP
jgi:hypothetical protein